MKNFLALAALLVLLPTLGHAAVSPQDAAKKTPYEMITPPVPTASGGKIEVVEIFFYGCPHCHEFHPYMEQWLKTRPANVSYVRMPAVLRDDWSLLGRAYYAAELLGVLDKSHTALFDAIHKGKRQELFTEDGLANFYADYGVNKDTFRKTLYSFAVETKISWSKQMVRRYRIGGTPTVIINGKYRVDPGMTNGFDGMIRTVDYLVKQEGKRS
ncbi:MAG: thiol:disulfide interchange protein DsbA/DsbL [Gammaproteobacteria bacterium]|nr:thiol:disulfide interchange protein DsbA/DsbL [Gammaproteobacteria bacterium]